MRPVHNLGFAPHSVWVGCLKCLSGLHWVKPCRVCIPDILCAAYRNGAAVSQIRCGDLYADKAVEAFTACAVSDKKCVPQRVDATSYPVPPDCALDKSFDLNNFQVSAAPRKSPQAGWIRAEEAA